jgi:hypothetical protein
VKLFAKFINNVAAGTIVGGAFVLMWQNIQATTPDPGRIALSVVACALGIVLHLMLGVVLHGPRHALLNDVGLR